MENNYEQMLNKHLSHLVSRFNSYSELVALNYHHNCEESTLQWNRGHEAAFEDEATELAKQMGKKVNYELRKSVYRLGDHDEFEIEYRAMFVTA